MIRIALAASFLVACPGDERPAAPVVDTAALLAEMVDLDRLTRPARYRCRQFSSYDRRSTSPDDPETWFANDDRGHDLGVDPETGLRILARAEGPGAIVRIWSANPHGRVRLEIDGRPALDVDFGEWLSGEVPGFPPPFAQTTSRGGNLYYPIPYARSMRLLAEASDLYFHVQIRQEPPGTTVRSFDPGERPPLPDLAPPAPPPESRVTRERRLVGPGVVRRLEIDLPEDPQRLRRTLLRIRVDGRLAVLAPLGDFFGTAPGITPYATLPLGVTEEGVGWCAFPMPFASEWILETDVPSRVWVTPDERPLRFVAHWRGASRLPTRPFKDVRVLEVGEGGGRLVGCALFVRNPVRAWWGEGDEKIYVDDLSFPAFFGTGTEDYFGYAWCDPTPFQHPFHAQTRCDGPGNRGHTTLLRFHVFDDVPFRERLRFDLELWHWVDCEVGFATCAYAYVEPDAEVAMPEPGWDDLELVPLPPIPRVEGAIEGESLEVVEKTAGVCGPQDVSWAEGFSGEEHLWWREAGPGDRLVLAFRAPENARRLVVRLTRAPDYGIVRLLLNGRPLGDPIDLFASRVEPAPERTFDAPALRHGRNLLEVRIVGTNEAARPKNYMFGIDYLRVE